MKCIYSDSSKSTISNLDHEMIQPNAIDLRVRDVFKISQDTFTIDSKNNKSHRGSEKIEPIDNFWILQPGSYEIITNHDVTIAENEAGYVITRSTFVRNGCFLVSGLYDSGFSGSVGCLLIVTTGTLKLERGTRIGQFILQDAECVGTYEGSYGSGKEFDKNRYEV